LGYRGLIVGLTGVTGAAERQAFKVDGASCVLSKPISIEELTSEIAAFDSPDWLGEGI
jgi:hypothetical protein